MLPHPLLEFFPGLSEGILLILLSLMLVIVKPLDYFRVFLLHLHQKVAQGTEESHIFLHKGLGLHPSSKDLKVFGDFLDISDTSCPIVIKHEDIPDPPAVPLHLPQVSPHDVVMHVHIKE